MVTVIDVVVNGFKGMQSSVLQMEKGVIDCCRNIGHFRKMCQHKKINAPEVVENSSNESSSVEEEAYSIRLVSVV